MIDKILHVFYKELPAIHWFSYDDNFSFYYAEEGLYVVKHNTSGAFYFVKARSPKGAIRLVMDKRSNAYDNDMYRKPNAVSHLSGGGNEKSGE